ncbi:YdiU family protein [Alphaproteobacteria bacterium KMM 3653]|uniref:Protein nucleotidyltransferase YdiU n=1 Tax=Harenicola maris TaxID=2841044 RepID=A0AAP2CR82_9RHOB|nr:YdiU family protein [Harenicola maris]
MKLPLQAQYAALPDRFFAAQPPKPVAAPDLLFLNAPLAESLGLDPAALRSPEGIDILAGNAVAEGTRPLAQVYSGHQFGNFSPQLGDGRALLLGEVEAEGKTYDIQLKGSGPTPFSRNGDGRAGLGPVLREYIMSEAMQALGVPTTRALAAVTTGERVQRETALPGAILTRVARSHIRVGTFQFFAARQDTEALQILTDFAITRHYPEATDALDLLRAVVQAQAELIAHWMTIGFVHGVMNTDNCAVSGETIDYGPAAFLDTYHPNMVFSSIDRNGRYAFGQQPNIAAWNLAQLATALLPLMGEREAAIEAATEAVNGFGPALETAWLARYRAKLGLTSQQEGDVDLITSLLRMMAEGQADFTNTFRALGTAKARDQFVIPTAFDAWNAKWQGRLAAEGPAEDLLPRLHAANPAIIPRTHRIEQAITAATAGDLTPAKRLIIALETPFEATDPDLARPPSDEERITRTFCGT